MSDLIEREDAIKVLHEVKFWTLASAEATAIEAIKCCKSARPKGEWIDAEIPLESGGSMPIQVCNLCKTFYPLAYTGGGHRFCPNCGAKMKGADDE